MSRGFRNCEVLVFAYAYAKAGEVMKFVRSLLHRETAQQRTSHRRTVRTPHGERQRPPPEEDGES